MAEPKEHAVSAARYLITGGAGFIGRHLAQAIASRGDRARILDSFDTGDRSAARALEARFPALVEVVEADVRDRIACDNACRDVDFVLHHAAIASVRRSIDDPERSVSVNIGGTATLLAAALSTGSVRRVVLASSSAVYGDLPGEVKRETDPLNPLSPYATTKIAGEHLCRNYSRLLGLETVSLRYFNVYGQGQDPSGPYAAVIPNFVNALVAGITPVIYGDGGQVRDFVHVRDVVDAHLAACHAPAQQVAGGVVFNIAGGQPTTLKSLLSELACLAGQPVEPRYEPGRAGDIRRSVADIAAARTALGFSPSVDLTAGLAGVLAAARAQAGG